MAGLFRGGRELLQVVPGRSYQVLAWGANQMGQCGVGGGSASPVVAEPTEVPGLREVAGVAAGALHSAAFSTSGEMWTWGDDSAGKLGREGGDGHTPRQVEGLAEEGAHIVGAGLGAHHSLSVDARGRVFAWGENKEGQLGIGTALQQIARQHREQYDLGSLLAASQEGVPSGLLNSGQEGLPVQVGRPLVPSDLLARLLQPPAEDAVGEEAGAPGLEAEQVVEVAASRYFSVTRTAAGGVWTFGAGYNGELSQGEETWVTSAQPIQGPAADALAAGGGAARVCAGGTFTLALTADGQALVWGMVGAGHLVPSNSPYPDWGATSTPELITESTKGGAAPAPHGLPAGWPLEVAVPGRLTSIAAGRAHALCSDGERVWYVGGSNAPPWAPMEVFRTGGGGAGVVAVSAGLNRSAFITTDGELYAWGGGLGGLHEAIDEGIPQLVATLAGCHVLQVALGAKHALAMVK